MTKMRTAKIATIMICLGLLICPSNADAQDLLIGTWEAELDDEDGDFTTRLMLSEDGQVNLSFSGQVSDELLGEEEEGEESPFSEPVNISFAASGTWIVQDSLLVIDLTQKDLRINGKPFAEGIDDIGELVATSLAEDLDIPDEDLPALVATVQAALREQLNEEELLADFTDLLEGGIAYTVMGDELRLDDGEGSEEIWNRVKQTVIRTQSWGMIKVNSWTN